MYNYHTKAIQGCSIANIVIAAIGIILCIVACFGMGIAGSVLSGYDSYYYDTADAYAAMAGAGVIAFFTIICLILVLIAGIITVTNVNKPAKYGMIFVWNVIGAIAGLLGAGLIGGILCIIVAVFTNMDKKAYLTGYAPMSNGAPAQAGQPYASQPYTGQPNAAQPYQAQTGVVQPPAAQPGQVQPVQPQPGQSQPGIAQPIITQPTIVQPSIDPAGQGAPGVPQDPQYPQDPQNPQY